MMPNTIPNIIPNIMQNNINQNQAQNEPIEIDINFALLYGIKDPIKIIKFKNSSNNEIFKATISKFFTKSELYWLIGFYVKSNFVLIYKDDILENDESNIDDIPDGTTIEVYNKINDQSHTKNPYYHYLLEKYKNCSKINFICYFREEKLNFTFPSDISISQMIKAMKFDFTLKNDVKIIYNSQVLQNDNSKLSQKFSEYVHLDVVEDRPIQSGFPPRKIIQVIILVKDKNIVKTENITRFNSIQTLIFDIEIKIKSKIKKLWIEDKEINLNDEKTISSLGINDNSICVVEI